MCSVVATSTCQVAVIPRCSKRHRGSGHRLLPSPKAGPALRPHCSSSDAGTPASAAAGARSIAAAHSNVRTRRTGRCGGWPRASVAPAASATSGSGRTPDEDSTPSSSYDTSQPPAYTLEDTRTLVETAMLAAVSGLAYLLSTILKLDNTLGYFLPLPVVLAALRSGSGAGWRTMVATCFLIVVLLGPIRAMSYFFLHGLLAATLGSLWRYKANFWVGVVLGAGVRMFGQMAYLLMSSVTMNENMFALLLSNIYNMLDRISATLGMTGAPSPTAVICMVFSLLLVNGLTYCFLLHVVYRFVLGTMGYQVGPLPGLVNWYMQAGRIKE